MALARKRGPEDRSRINLSEHYEIDFWTSRFECSEAELRDAVNRLGTCAHVVKSFLRNRKLRVGPQTYPAGSDPKLVEPA